MDASGDAGLYEVAEERYFSPHHLLLRAAGGAL